MLRPLTTPQYTVQSPTSAFQKPTNDNYKGTPFHQINLPDMQLEDAQVDSRKSIQSLYGGEPLDTGVNNISEKWCSLALLY